MNKKDELKTLLDSKNTGSTNQKPLLILEQTIKKSTQKPEIPAMKTEVNSASTIADRQTVITTDELINPMMNRIEPSEADIVTIRALEKENDYFIQIFDVFTTNEEKCTSSFMKGEMLYFHIVCAVSDIFSKLSAEFQMQAISQDLLNLSPQRIYGFSFNCKLESPCFEIVYQANAVLEGIFKFQVILTIGQIENFCMNDTCIYRII
ncbi:hypothetical protein JW960_12845 [candidate division KSB1 bacterium]|nr:hypothetical protein [candidate division KSB1 bacterium]